jgi:hypothetical protein
MLSCAGRWGSFSQIILPHQLKKGLSTKAAPFSTDYLQVNPGRANLGLSVGGADELI